MLINIMILFVKRTVSFIFIMSISKLKWYYILLFSVVIYIEVINLIYFTELTTTPTTTRASTSTPTESTTSSTTSTTSSTNGKNTNTFLLTSSQTNIIWKYITYSYVFNSNSGFARIPKGRYCHSNTELDNVRLKPFNARRTIPNPTHTNSPPTDENIEDALIARNECEVWCSNDPKCWGCSVVCGNSCAWNALSRCGTFEKWIGLIEGDITQKSGMRMKCIINKRMFIILNLISSPMYSKDMAMAVIACPF